MKEVAQLLGVEIGEEFKIEGHSGNVKYRLTEEGLEYFSCGNGFTISSTLNRLLNGEYKVVKIPKPVLDDVEKKYLSRIIRPWKNEVESIRKFKSIFDGYEFLVIKVKTEVRLNTTTLPYFKKWAMYKGMELNKEYTIKDLGL